MTRYNYTFTGKKISETAEFSEASASELKILMALIDLSGEATDEELMQKCDTSKSRVSAAIALWEESGVIKLLQEGESALPYGNRITEEFPRSFSLHDDTETKAVEIARTIRNAGLASLFDECAALLGKPMLSPSEIRCLAELSSQYKLSDEYIAMLAAHLSDKGGFTVRQLANRAIKLSSDGITSPEELKTYISEKESRGNMYMEYRRLLGIYDRALSPTEKKYFEKWSNEYLFGTEIVGLAYDISILNTSKRSLKYMDTLLLDWKENGCKKLADCEKRYEAAKAERAAEIAKEEKKPKQGGSYQKKPKDKERFGDFDPEEAMRRAIERSFGPKKSDTEGSQS
ncbi:MAG: DnaD domain protein [Clostridia bacterium]|nr:DnaD domain protein [Clostridia bacterium]